VRLQSPGKPLLGSKLVLSTRGGLKVQHNQAAVSVKTGRFAATPSLGHAAAENQSYRSTVAEKLTPVRRLTVNRKTLWNHASLAQPPISGNGLYCTSGHPVESDRLPQARCSPRQVPRGLPCLTAATAFAPLAGTSRRGRPKQTSPRPWRPFGWLPRA